MKKLLSLFKNGSNSKKGIGMFGIAAIAVIIALIVGVVVGAVMFSIDTGIVRELDHISLDSRSANVQNPMIVDDNALMWDIEIHYDYLCGRSVREPLELPGTI